MRHVGGCYSAVAALLQRCCSAVAVLLQRCCIDAATWPYPRWHTHGGGGTLGLADACCIGVVPPSGSRGHGTSGIAATRGLPLCLPLGLPPGIATVTWLGHWELQVGTATTLGVCPPPSEYYFSVFSLLLSAPAEEIRRRRRLRRRRRGRRRGRHRRPQRRAPPPACAAPRAAAPRSTNW